tara:strand:+ start:210 stop:515 length:306 start_codon:yes stop_codon:yes gene_type:complete
METNTFCFDVTNPIDHIYASIGDEDYFNTNNLSKRMQDMESEIKSLKLELKELTKAYQLSDSIKIHYKRMYHDLYRNYTKEIVRPAYLEVKQDLEECLNKD